VTYQIAAGRTSLGGICAVQFDGLGEFLRLHRSANKSKIILIARPEENFS